ncbi:MAG TPA: type II toxin-antitoxin system RelE/ParE family toxin [Candidatus Nanoarchaeia archaeon]|nr:type II toxin-antitoxin system RelE/ParE family toxin [Candidatus Nanoarchaeia archaeon]
MSYEIIWDRKTRDFLKKIHKEDAQRIIKKVNSIGEDPKHYLETLVDINAYKLRVGDYRVLIDIHEKERTLFIILIGHRKDIYKYIHRIWFRKKT